MHLKTTLASKSYVSLMKKAREVGYEIHLIFFWLNSVDMAKERVKQRAQKGGHNIPTDVIERRYKAGIVNLNELYINFVDNWMLFDNSDDKHELIATGGLNQISEIKDEEKFKVILK